jgi:hypothetical protein
VNTLFRIAFGDYEFVLDRTNLTYSLTETVTQTVWATALSLGWIELKDRETGAITRTDFGDCKLISIAEKMGAAGKRILLGLDAPGGVPIDIYLICGPKEIQLTVEASRDSKTHLLERVGLLPGLCHAEQGEYLVIPHAEGRMLCPKPFREEKTWMLRVWEPWEGLTMPFTGAVSSSSALALLTDSVYAAAEIDNSKTEIISANWVYERDSERRRLDIRMILIPNGDYISIARAYRDKLIGERNHITLRKKLRENPELGKLIGNAFVNVGEKVVAPFSWTHDLTAVQSQNKNQLMSLSVEASATALSIAFLAHCLYYVADDTIWWKDGEERICRWDRMEHRLKLAEVARKKYPVVGVSGSWGDWIAVGIDFCLNLTESDNYFFCYDGTSLPLHAVIWRDAIIFPITLSPDSYHSFLRALLQLSIPCFDNPYEFKQAFYEATCAVLCPLNALTFPAFLTAHQFLTHDFLVEEAFYSDKTYVLINQSETEPYDAGEFWLPPGGFYVRHPQFEAHDALRVRTVEFPKRAWRVRRSLDGKPLEQSEQIEEREFEVSI